MLLFDICKDGDVFGSNFTTVTKQITGTCIHQAFICHVSKNKGLGANKIEFCKRVKKLRIRLTRLHKT